MVTELYINICIYIFLYYRFNFFNINNYFFNINNRIAMIYKLLFLSFAK